MLSNLRKRSPRGLAVLWVSLAAVFSWSVPASSSGARTVSARGQKPGRSASTLDPALQEVAGQLLRGARPIIGGIVAVHAPTGRILALNEFQRAGQTRRPLTHAITPAASLFKIVTTVALYDRGGVAPGKRVCIRGGERGIQRTHLTAPRGPGDVLCRPFEEALGFSRNAVFAQLATQHLLHRDLIEVAEQLGFNRPLAADFPAEMGSLTVPYNDLEFARAAAGFQGSRLSVLGAAQLAYLVAAGGRAPRMTLNDRAPPGTAPPAGATDAETTSAPAMSPRAALRLRRMMEITVHSGTSLEAFTAEDGSSYLGSIRAAGKTGTLRRAGGSATTSWFIGFAPSRAPELVVSVMLENGAVWRRKANQVARDLMRAYFHDRPGVTHPREAAGRVVASEPSLRPK